MKHIKHWLATMAVLLCSLTASAHDFEVGGIYYNITSSTDLTVEVTYKGSSKDEYSEEYSGTVIVPDFVTFNDCTYRVTEIGDRAFIDNYNLNFVTIPEGVTSIGDYAFCNCNDFNSITFPKNSQLTSIGNYAFYACLCLTSITIPEGVTSIGNYAFVDCYLKSITIPEGVTSIGEETFSWCRRLASVTIPESVTSIGNNAFYRCSNLTTVTFPEKSELTEIGSQAFEFCSSLTSITIPESVTSIGDYAFPSGLTAITCEAVNPPTINYNTFDGVNKSIPLYVPRASISAYQAASYWKNFTNIQAIPAPKTTLPIMLTEADGLLEESSISTNSAGVEQYEYTSPVYSLDEATNTLCFTFLKGGATTSSLFDKSGFPFVALAEFYLYDGEGNEIALDASNFSTNAQETTEGAIGNICDDERTTFWHSKWSGDGVGTYHNLMITLPEGTELSEFQFGYITRYCTQCLPSVVLVDSTDEIESVSYSGTNGNGLNWTFNDGNLVFEGTGVVDAVGFGGVKSVEIAEGVTGIGNYAFQGCSSLTSITIPESVTEIGEDAFLGTPWYDNQPDGVIYVGKMLYKYKGTMPAYTSIEVREGTASIAPCAFRYCSNLASIILPGSVTSIGDKAFYECSSLTTVTIPENSQLTSVGDYAFDDCDGLTSITIPEGVTSIGEGAFYGCEGLTSITIPEGVTEIGNYAFSGCYGLTSITLPESVTSIGEEAFSGCDGLTSITLPEGVTSIGEGAFYGCDGLTSITLPEGVTSIGEEAFYYCRSLTSITLPESVTSIGEWAFYNCSSLTTVTIPENSQLTSIGHGAFYGCTGELIVNCNIPSASSSSNGAFYGAKFTKVTIGDRVTSIGKYAFYDCSSLTAITLPESVTSIGDYAFSDCSSLTTVTIPESVTSIGEYAFNNCSRLTAVHISNIETWCKISFSSSTSNPLYYGKNLYLNGELVTELVIPEGVMSIGNYAFDGCSSLTTINIPESVTSIGNAFRGCSSLAAVSISSIEAWCKISFIDSFSNPLYYANNLYLNGELVTELVIPEGVTSIGDYAFNNCRNLTAITIPASMTNIGEEAFSSCHSLYKVFNNSSLSLSKGSSSNGYVAYYAKVIYQGGKLTTIGDFQFYTSEGIHSLVNYIGNETVIELPDGYNGESYEVGSAAFAYCRSLTSIDIPENSRLTSIGDYAFYDCRNLTAITIPASMTNIGEEAFSGCSRLYKVFNNSSLSLSKGSSSYGYVAYYAKVIYQGGKLTTVGDFQFYTSEGIHSLVNYIGNDTEVVLPDSYNGESYEIGIAAFSDCDGLTAINIPEGVTSIGDYAFSNCDGLTAINIPESVTSIGSYAFSDCDGLTAINIPEDVTSIGNGAFQGCSSLERVMINCANVGNWFGGKFSIKEVVLGESVTSIGDYAFDGCSSLTAITIPESVTSIGSGAFRYCSSLTTVTIPENSQLTSIGGYAFSDCSGLTAINIPESVTSIGSYAFHDCTNLYKVFNNSSLSLSKGSSSYGYVAYYAKVIYQGDRLTTIGDFQFYTSEGIHSLVNYIGNETVIELPDDYNGESYEIGDWAFAYCRSLTSITLPASVTSIGSDAFYNCSSLTSITIPEGVTSIGRYAFYYCSGLTAINIPESVTSIGSYAFYYCDGLTAITIPESVTSIGDKAFAYCRSLERVMINCANVGDWFSGFSSIKEVVLGEGVTSIGSSAFKDCSSLASITVFEGVTSIGNYAFSGCGSLTAITIPASVTSIGDDIGSSCGVFSNCTSLKEVIFEDGTETLAVGCDYFYRSNNPRISGRGLFSACPLEKVYLGRNLNYDTSRYAGYSPFYNKGTLTSLTIGPEVTEIGANAFSGCSAIDTIHCHAVVPPICYYASTFTGVDTSIPVYVPEGSVVDYQAAEVWKNFFNFVGADLTGIDNLEPTDNGEQQAVIYDLMGRRVTNPTKGGIYIVNGRKVIYK